MVRRFSAMAHRESKPFAEILGTAIRGTREVSGKRQDDLAAVAREYGLPWTRATVAAIEIGRRRLSVEEFLLLPAVLDFIELADLLPGDRWVSLTTETSVHTEDLAQILTGKAGARNRRHYDTPALRKLQNNKVLRQQLDDLVQGKVTPKFIQVIRHVWPEMEHNKDLLLDCEMEAERDAEQKAARRLNVSPFAIALAARKIWRRSLTAERDRRGAVRETDEMVPTSRKAIRGHVTRMLVEEIRPLVAGVCEDDERRSRI